MKPKHGWKSILSRAEKVAHQWWLAQQVGVAVGGIAVIVAYGSGWSSPIVWGFLVALAVGLSVGAHRAETTGSKALWIVGVVAVVLVAALWAGSPANRPN